LRKTVCREGARLLYAGLSSSRGMTEADRSARSVPIGVRVSPHGAQKGCGIMKQGMEVPRPVIVVVIVLVVVIIGFFGRKAILAPQRIQMSPEAINGMKAHMASQGGSGAPTTPQPGMGSKQHSN